MDNGPIMMTTPGITEPHLSKEPLMDEGEATVGPDDVNPFRSADEREIVEAYREKQRQQRKRDVELTKDDGPDVPFGQPTGDPTAGDDPFVFDDIGGEVGNLRLPFADNDGPEFPKF